MKVLDIDIDTDLESDGEYETRREGDAEEGGAAETLRSRMPWSACNKQTTL